MATRTPLVWDEALGIPVRLPEGDTLPSEALPPGGSADGNGFVGQRAITEGTTSDVPTGVDVNRLLRYQTWDPCTITLIGANFADNDSIWISAESNSMILALDDGQLWANVSEGIVGSLRIKHGEVVRLTRNSATVWTIDGDYEYIDPRPQVSNLDVHISLTGDDLTGDGTEGNPLQTIFGAQTYADGHRINNNLSFYFHEGNHAGIGFVSYSHATAKSIYYQSWSGDPLDTFVDATFACVTPGVSYYVTELTVKGIQAYETRVNANDCRYSTDAFGYSISAGTGGTIYVSRARVFGTGAAAFIYADGETARVFVEGPLNFTANGSTGAFDVTEGVFWALNGALIEIREGGTPTAVTGTATGRRFNVSLLAHILNQVGDDTWPPGSLAGEQTLGGLYIGNDWVPPGGEVAAGGGLQGLRVITGTTDTPTAADVDYMMRYQNAGTTAVTLTAGSIPALSVIHALAEGGTITINPGAGQTFIPAGSPYMTQGNACSFVYLGGNTWVIVGGIEGGEVPEAGGGISDSWILSTDYELEIKDKNNLIICDNAAEIEVTLGFDSGNADYNFDQHHESHFFARAAGGIVFFAGAGDTLQPASGLRLPQGGACTVVYLGASTWMLVGAFEGEESGGGGGASFQSSLIWSLGA